MGALRRRELDDKDSAWLIEVDEKQFRWCISADDNGIEMHAQFYDKGGTLLVVKGLMFDPLPSDWRQGDPPVDEIRFNSLPDLKVAELIRTALERGWRHDLDQQIFRL